MTYSETQSSAGHCSWSDHDNDNDDPGVVSEIEDEMLEEIGRVTPVLTPTHSTEDILDMFDKTGECIRQSIMQQENVFGHFSVVCITQSGLLSDEVAMIRA